MALLHLNAPSPERVDRTTKHQDTASTPITHVDADADADSDADIMG